MALIKNEQDKLVFEPFLFNQQRQSKPMVRIDTEAAKAVSYVASKTGLPLSEIASAMIKYASEHIEINYGNNG